MSTLADRLRGIVTSGRSIERAPSRESALPDAGVESQGGASPGSAAAASLAAAEYLGGEWVESDGGQFLRVERTYRPGHRHGRLALLDHVPPERGRWVDVLLGPGSDRPAPAERTRALFIDLETTGLTGGAGAYAFLVGCGWFEGVTFRIRQLFLSSFTAERALLASLADLARQSTLVVSYNGKTFDLPLIETRFAMNRMPAAFGTLPHLDVLHHARRLWRADGERDEDGAGCRLIEVERTVCGHAREGDVPGFEIPGRYFHFVRTGDPRPLANVLEHNRLDLLSLAFLTARAAQLVEDGPSACRSAREALGMGKLYERAGAIEQARACYARACGADGVAPLPGSGAVRAEALRSYAVLCRRARRYPEAAAAWQQLLESPGCPPPLLREATEALAIHHEHRLRDPGTARTFALRSAPLQATMARQQALQYRLARLDRKLQRMESAAPLF